MFCKEIHMSKSTTLYYIILLKYQPISHVPLLLLHYIWLRFAPCVIIFIVEASTLILFSKSLHLQRYFFFIKNVNLLAYKQKCAFCKSLLHKNSQTNRRGCIATYLCLVPASQVSIQPIAGTIMQGPTLATLFFEFQK